MKRILITAPLRQDVDIFEEYQKGLDALKVPEGFTVSRFFVVNDCDEVIPFIHNAEYVTVNTGDEYRKTDNNHEWTPELMTKMSGLRNRTIAEALNGGYDYWFSVDTDLVLDPRTLCRLIEADRDIVSEIFWTQHWCNAWDHDQYSPPRDEWRKPGLYKVGMTGACIMVKTAVFEAGVDYTQIPNIRKALRGEDRHFCVRAACAGFELWVETSCPATHLYTREEYERFTEGKKCLRK